MAMKKKRRTQAFKRRRAEAKNRRVQRRVQRVIDRLHSTIPTPTPTPTDPAMKQVRAFEKATGWSAYVHVDNPSSCVVITDIGTKDDEL